MAEKADKEIPKGEERRIHPADITKQIHDGVDLPVVDIVQMIIPKVYIYEIAFTCIVFVIVNISVNYL